MGPPAKTRGQLPFATSHNVPGVSLRAAHVSGMCAWCSISRMFAPPNSYDSENPSESKDESGCLDSIANRGFLYRCSSAVRSLPGVPCGGRDVWVCCIVHSRNHDK